MLHIIDMHRKATREANEKVPIDFELGSKEHDEWLAAFDAAYTRIVLKGE